MKVSVLVPAFNEAGVIRSTVLAVSRVLAGAAVDHEIIVIDDGSTDETSEAASGIGAEVLRHPINIGYGRALKTGLRHATGDVIAIIDADGSYPAEALPQLIGEMGAYDMVVGARQGNHYYSSTAKWFGRKALERMVLFVTGVRVPDVNSGMRTFRRQIALDHIDQIGNGFSFTTTLTLAMLLEGHFVHYLPVPYRARHGSSKVNLRRDVVRTVQILVMAIIAYNPIKLFLLLAYAALAATLGCIALDILVDRGSQAALILVIGFASSLGVFALGLTTDIVRRLLR